MKIISATYAQPLAVLFVVIVIFALGFQAGKHAQMLNLVCSDAQMGMTPLCK